MALDCPKGQFGVIQLLLYQNGKLPTGELHFTLQKAQKISN